MSEEKQQHKPYTLTVPIPPNKEKRMDEILQTFGETVKVVKKEFKNIIVGHWGTEIKKKALIYSLIIVSTEKNIMSFGIRNQDIAGQLQNAILLNGILDQECAHFIKINNNFGLPREVLANSLDTKKILADFNEDEDDDKNFWI